MKAASFAENGVSKNFDLISSASASLVEAKLNSASCDLAFMGLLGQQNLQVIVRTAFAAECPPRHPRRTSAGLAAAFASDANSPERGVVPLWLGRRVPARPDVLLWQPAGKLILGFNARASPIHLAHPAGQLQALVRVLVQLDLDSRPGPPARPAGSGRSRLSSPG